MAELDAIHVKITGDASGLESAVRGAKSSLSSLEQYKNSMQAAQNTLNKSRAVLNNTQRAYEANTKSVTANIEALTKQKTSLETSIATKNNEIKALEHANTVVNKGSIAYKDNVKAIEWTKTELSSLEQQHKRVTDSIRTQETVLAGSKKAYEDAQATVKLATKQYEDYEKGLKAVERAEQAQQLQETGKKWKDTSDTINSVTKPLQYTALALAAGGAAAGKFAIDFEDSFAAVKKTVDGTPEQLEQIKQDIIDMTTVGINGHSAIPLTTAELNELAAAGGQLGISTEGITDFTETMAMLGTATNLVGEQGAATIARFQNVMQIPESEIRNVGSAIVDLGNNSATTEAEIAAMALRMGKYGQTVRMSAADVLGYSAALSSMGVEAQLGGSAVGRTWLSIETAVAEGGADLKAFAKYSGKSAKEFKEQWNTDSKGAFNGLLEGLKAADNLTLALSDVGIKNTQDIQAMQALVNGYDLVTESVDRANTAYAENTALQEEFNAKAETTASQIQVVKNNAVEAARGFGEVMLPTIKDVTSVMADYARSLADMSDDSKRKLVSVAGGIVALGAVSKGVVVGTKAIGGFIEGVGKIKGALAAGGALTKIAPMITAIGSAAGPTAIAIAGVGAAALIAKGIYDNWYDSNYKFAEGLNEQTEKLKETRKQWKSLNDLRWEYNDLTGKINSKSLEGEELENAQARLGEIVKILKDEYKIDVDSGDIDEALAKAEQLAQMDALKQETALKKQLDSDKNAYDNAVKKLPQVTKEYKDAAASAQKYRDAQNKIAEYDNQFANHEISETGYLNRLKEIMTDIEGEGSLALGGFLNDIDHLTDKSLAGANATQRLNSKIAELYVDDKEKAMNDLSASIDEYKQAAEGLADINLDHFTDAIKAGADGDKYLQRIAQYAKEGLVDADEFAKKAALIVSGQENVNSVFEQGEGAISSYVTDYVSKMQLFGASNEQVKVGLDSLAAAYTKFLDDAGKLPEGQHVEFTAEGEVIFVANYDGLEDAPDQSGTVNYDADYSGIEEPPVKRGTVIYEAVMPDSLKNTNYGKYGVSVFREAIGTSNFPGGLAMVNDQKGIADPRELIIDRGRAFIPEGKDVILPLSKGAKVYTAAQTKAIMSGAGIPHYAEGKNNSDAFTKARDDWSHFAKTHAVTTVEEIQKWLEFQEKYKQNEKDIWDIEEQVFSLRQKQYSEQTKASEAWLTHETKYNGLAVTEQLDAIDRIRKNVAEALAQGLISYEEYLDTIAAYDEKYIDKRKEQIAEMYDISKGYISEHTYFNDWGDYGDDPIEAYKRVQNDRLNELRAGELTQKEYDEYMTSLGSDMFSERIEQSKNWLEEQRRYFNLSAEDYTKGIERMKEYTQEYLNEGLISRREYNEAMTELNHMAWDEAESAYEEMLKRQSDYISEMRDKFSKEEQALRDSWTVEDRKADMATVSEQLRVYKGAVTERGQQKYKELQEQMKKLKRDEELYNLQVKNNAVIEQYEAEYKQLEADKKKTLAQIASVNKNISTIVGTFTDNLEGTATSMITLLQQILNTVNTREFVGPVLSDNRNITQNITQLTPEQIQEMYSMLGR